MTRIIFIAIVLVLLLPTIPITAQDSNWEPPFEVSSVERTPSSWFPDLAAGPDDSIHIIWSSGIANGPNVQDALDLLMYRSVSDGTWSDINDIYVPGTGGFTVRNSMALGQDGRFHVLLRSLTNIKYTSAPWDEAWSAGAWEEAQRIDNSGSYYDEIAVDSKGTLHIFWNESVPNEEDEPYEDCPDCADVFYRYSINNGETWSLPFNVSETLDGSTKPQVKLSGDDEIHVVWEEGYDSIVGEGLPTSGYYRRSRDGGATWDEPSVFTLPDFQPSEEGAGPIPDAPQQMTVGLYQNTAPIIVYRGTATSQMYYHTSDDGGANWSEARLLPGARARYINTTPWDGYTMTTDGDGKVHFVFSGFPATETDSESKPRLMHMIWNGRSWSAPDVIMDESDYPGWDAAKISQCEILKEQRINTDEALNLLEECRLMRRMPEWPNAIVNGSQLHVAWFTRNDSDTFRSDQGASYQVWYSTRQLNASSVETLTQVEPTAQPTAVAPTATPAPEPTPTLPPEVVNAVLPDQPLAWEGPGVATVAFASLPVLGFLGVVIFGRALWHRRRTQR